MLRSALFVTTLLVLLPVARPCAAERPAKPLQVSEERALKAGDRFKECETCPELIVVPAGSFIMGSPNSEPGRSSGELQRKITIRRPFAVGRFAVTFDEWDSCVSHGGCAGYRPSDERWGRGMQPVINVRWDDVTAYLAWLAHEAGRPYRLLSETEREYAARAGTTTPFWWGSAITPAQANYQSNYVYAGGGAKGKFRGKPVPVDSFEPNPWGLYGVHGNVWEWTEDCWNRSNDGNPGNGLARKTGECDSRVLRGGSWTNNPIALRSAKRYYDSVLNRNIDVGFRVARDLAR
jgi:formylglycine-generating enzyme required for sulfatase activity